MVCRGGSWCWSAIRWGMVWSGGCCCNEAEKDLKRETDFERLH